MSTDETIQQPMSDTTKRDLELAASLVKRSKRCAALAKNPYPNTTKAERLLLRAEGCSRAVLHVEVELLRLPWWAWLRRHALCRVGQAITANAASLIGLSELADEAGEP